MNRRLPPIPKRNGRNDLQQWVVEERFAQRGGRRIGVTGIKTLDRPRDLLR